MRLLHVTHQYRPAVGGAEQHITSLSEEMAQREHDVTVLASRSRDYLTWRNELPPVEYLNRVHVHRFWSLGRGKWTWRMLDYGYRHYMRTRSSRYEPWIFWGNGPVCPGLFWAVFTQAARYDLVHINNLHYAHAATAFAAARLRGLPVVLTPHIHLEQPVTYDVRYMRNMLNNSDHVLADTRAERRFLLDMGLDHQRVTTAGVGIYLEDFPILDRQTCRRALGLPADAFVLLFLGRKTEYKGLDVVLEAFGALQEQYPRLHLIALGADTDYSRALWARYSDSARLLNLGNVPNETRLAALNACDCLALPSSGEAFGLVYLEAWAVGKPVIGAQTRAVSSLVADGLDGFLIPPGNVGKLMEYVVHLLENPAQVQRMGERGRAKVTARYTVSRVADVVEGVYLRVLRRHYSRSRSGGQAALRHEKGEA
jgi:glycosyltransferase involved in cell wall biosynthesis